MLQPAGATLPRTHAKCTHAARPWVGGNAISAAAAVGLVMAAADATAARCRVRDLAHVHRLPMRVLCIQCPICRILMMAGSCTGDTYSTIQQSLYSPSSWRVATQMNKLLPVIWHARSGGAAAAAAA